MTAGGIVLYGMCAQEEDWLRPKAQPPPDPEKGKMQAYVLPEKKRRFIHD